MKRAWQRELDHEDYWTEQQRLADQQAGHDAAQAHDAAVEAKAKEEARIASLADLLKAWQGNQARDEILRDVFPTDEEVAEDFIRHGGI